MTFPDPKWLPNVSDTLDIAAAVDKGGGEVGLPITGHGFVAEQIVDIAGTVNYDGAYEINSATANEIVITATYVAETFAGTETVDFGKQVILKGDFRNLEDQIMGQPTVRLQPPLVWVDAATVRVEATADSPVWTALSGLPNILNSFTQVSGGLSDGKARGITANVSCLFASGGLYGTTQTEKVSQWYAIYATAGDTATDFALKAMPIMRVMSQTGQAIKCGTLLSPGSGINYAFTNNDLAGGKVYFQTGASRGLMRTISANDVDTDTRITYTGAALTVAAGDWFIVLPPTNFRLVGTVFNDASGNIVKFRRLGNVVQWLDQIILPVFSGSFVGEAIVLCCPFATHATVNKRVSGSDGQWSIGHAETTAAYNGGSSIFISAATGGVLSVSFNLEFCKFYHLGASDPNYSYANSYSYPPGTGY